MVTITRFEETLILLHVFNTKRIDHYCFDFLTIIVTLRIFFELDHRDENVFDNFSNVY